MRKLASKLSYANVMATIAVFLVLGGGAAVAAGGLAKNSVGAKQLKKNAVTAAKIKNGAVTGAKIKIGSLPPVPSATTLGGQPASAFAPSSVIRSAFVLGGGAVVAEKSSGIGQVNVSRSSEGIYCFNGLSPAPKTAVAVGAYGAHFEYEIFAQVNPSGEEDCAGSQIGVSIYVAEEESDEPFQLIVH